MRGCRLGWHSRHVLMLVMIFVMRRCSARGPHHPRGEIQHQIIDSHLTYEKEHIKEDLHDLGEMIPEKSIEEMTEDEKQFLYFKIHDLDGNGKLDGLELYYSATHHSVPHHSDDEENHINFQLLENAEDEEDLNFNHIVDILDNFLSVADRDNDGYLQFPEYAAAVKYSSVVV